MRSPITKITMLLFGIILSVTAKAQIVTTKQVVHAHCGDNALWIVADGFFQLA